jgi:hypothetical protein
MRYLEIQILEMATGCIAPGITRYNWQMEIQNLEQANHDSSSISRFDLAA